MLVVLIRKPPKLKLFRILQDIIQEYYHIARIFTIHLKSTDIYMLAHAGISRMIAR